MVTRKRNRAKSTEIIRYARHSRHNNGEYVYVKGGGTSVAQRKTRRVKPNFVKTYRGENEYYYKFMLSVADDEIKACHRAQDQIYQNFNLSAREKETLLHEYDIRGEKAVAKYNKYIDILKLRFGYKYARTKWVRYFYFEKW